MQGTLRRFSRRSLLAGMGAVPLFSAGTKGTAFPPDTRRYPDPLTELEVYRLTDPAYSSTLSAPYNRSITRNSNSMVFCCDRDGTPQAFRIDLKKGEEKQLTQAEALDGRSLTLTPDNRSFCYFAGRSVFITSLSTLRERELYKVPEGWERCDGMSVGPDGTHVTFAEKRNGQSRIRMVSLVQGVARTVIEAPFEVSDPIARPMRAQILYRRADQALWLVNFDGAQNRQLKTAEGRVGPADWSPDGKTVYFSSARDGHSCLWGQRIEAGSHRPVGEPFAAVHLHGRVYYRPGTMWAGWSAGGGRIAMLLAEDTGNIWMMSRQRSQ